MAVKVVCVYCLCYCLEILDVVGVYGVSWIIPWSQTHHSWLIGCNPVWPVMTYLGTWKNVPISDISCAARIKQQLVATRQIFFMN